MFKVKKISENATIPTKGSELAAGYDLYSAEDIIIKSKNKALIKTDIQIEIPLDCYARIAPRSGLANKNFIDVGAGVIDADYRGNIQILLFNFNDIDFQVNKGDRIAQLILEKIYTLPITEVEELNDTVRNDKGFGSTDKKESSTDQFFEMMN